MLEQESQEKVLSDGKRRSQGIMPRASLSEWRIDPEQAFSTEFCSWEGLSCEASRASDDEACGFTLKIFTMAFSHSSSVDPKHLGKC